MPVKFLADSSEDIEEDWACEIVRAGHEGCSVHDQGLNLCPLPWKCRVLTSGPPRNSGDWLIPFSNMRLNFLCVWIVHFFLALNNITSQGSATVHLLMVASNFWQL